MLTFKVFAVFIYLFLQKYCFGLEKYGILSLSTIDECYFCLYKVKFRDL